MFSLFASAAALGGLLLLVQLAMSLIGADHDAHDLHAHVGGASHAHEGLQLLSLRGIAAFLAFFGLAGIAVWRTPLPGVAALLAALLAGAVALIVVAYLMRSMRSMEEDGTLPIENAIGHTGTVYVPIAGGTAGKIHITVEGRLLELQAVTAAGRKLATGTAVEVVGVVGGDLVDVLPVPDAPR